MARRLALLMGIIVLLVGAGFGATSAAPAARGAFESASVRLSRHDAAATATKKVQIVDFAFSPKTITISKGTRVKWTNTGSMDHTSTSNTGIWDSGTIAPGGSFSRVFRKAGTFAYHCAIHPSMKGKVIVK